MALSLKLQGQRRFRDTARRLREAGRTDLVKQMAGGLRQAAKTALADQRREVQQLDINGVRGPARPARTRRPKPATGLRRRVAATVDLEVRTAGQKPMVRFVARGERMPAGQQNMPRNLDNPKGWRHPLFGDRLRWYAQRGGSWFWPPLQRHIRDFRKAIDDAITMVIEKIERS